jgi:hypothetical protein
MDRIRLIKMNRIVPALLAGALLCAAGPAIVLGQNVAPQAAVPPAPAPVLAQQAPPEPPPANAAKITPATPNPPPAFLATLLNGSIALGVSRTFPELVIKDKSIRSTDAVIEQYRGNGEPGVVLTLRSDSVNGSQADDVSGQAWFFFWGARASADFATFTGVQSLQTGPDGRLLHGTASGTFAFGGGEFYGALVWNNAVLPMAWGISQGFGFGFIQFDGTLYFDDGIGGIGRIKVSNDGIDPQLLLPFDIWWQLGKVRVRWMFVNTAAFTPSDTSPVRVSGGSGANYGYHSILSVYSVSYLFQF